MILIKLLDFYIEEEEYHFGKKFLVIRSKPKSARNKIEIKQEKVEIKFSSALSTENLVVVLEEVPAAKYKERFRPQRQSLQIFLNQTQDGFFFGGSRSFEAEESDFWKDLAIFYVLASFFWLFKQCSTFTGSFVYSRLAGPLSSVETNFKRLFKEIKQSIQRGNSNLQFLKVPFLSFAFMTLSF